MPHSEAEDLKQLEVFGVSVQDTQAIASAALTPGST